MPRLWTATRRTALAALAAAPMALGFGIGPASAESVLRIVPHADLKNLDPIWTTAYITRNHGYMVYDTLFAQDEQAEHPPADGGRAFRQRRRPRLYLHAPRRPEMA